MLCDGEKVVMAGARGLALTTPPPDAPRVFSRATWGIGTGESS